MNDGSETGSRLFETTVASGGLGRAGARLLSLSNPSSCRASPVPTPTMFSPPLPRRRPAAAAVPIPFSEQSPYPATASYPGISGFSAYPGTSGAGAYGGYTEVEPYGAYPSSFPSSSYQMLSGARGTSLGPGTSGMRVGSPGVSRRQLRPGRSLEGGADYPPGQDYLSLVGGGGVDIGTGSLAQGYPSQQPPLTQPLSVATSMGGGGMMGPMSTTPSGPPLPPPSSAVFSRDPYQTPLPVLQREHELLRREYDSAVQKLNSTMNSIKSFWSPELKKERAARKEEAGKLQLAQEQLRMASQDNQKQSGLTRQLQDELQCQYELRHQPAAELPPGVSRDSYQALRLERDRMHRELQLARDAMREMEVQLDAQRQTLVSRDESIKRLLDMLQAKGGQSLSAATERMELEQARQKAAEMEARCRYLEGTVSVKESDVRSLQEECLSAAEKLRQVEALQRLPPSGPDLQGPQFQALLDSKESRIEQLERQLVMYQEEAAAARAVRHPRDFTDKSVSAPEFQELKLKAEKAELELAHRQAELLGLQTRLANVGEQGGELKRQLQLSREQATAREQQVSLLQGDIEALRAKLETKNETLEQKAVALSALQTDKARAGSENADLSETIKIKDGKVQMLTRKMEGLEEFVKEKDALITHLKERLQNSPAMQQQRQLQDQVDEMVRERDRVTRELRSECEGLESQHIEQLDNHRQEVRELRQAVESLQKEITDRQMLIESQNEKICDLNREIAGLKTRLGSGSVDAADSSELGRVRSDLDVARMEVDKLLQMNGLLDSEREALAKKLKDTCRQLEDARRAARGGVTGGGGVGTTDYDLRPASAASTTFGGSSSGLLVPNERQQAQRIEELEEALRESVSITAERELAIAQQKQQMQLQEVRMKQYQTQLGSVSQQYESLGQQVGAMSASASDKDALARSLRLERRKHLEDVLSLKHEALVAAISEKDAHIALVEASGHKANPEELNTLRRHKDKLVRKLKDENEKRARLRADAAADIAHTYTGANSKAPTLDQELIDDGDGIWA